MLLKEAGNLPVAIVRPSIGELQREKVARILVTFKSRYSSIKHQRAAEWMGRQLERADWNCLCCGERNFPHDHVQ
jgi:hypothetical protein